MHGGLFYLTFRVAEASLAIGCTASIPKGCFSPWRSAMALDDFLEPEVAVAVGVTAAVMSPGVRKVLRRGAVYGLAGALMLGDKLAVVARGVSERARNLAASASNGDQPTASPADKTTSSPIPKQPVAAPVTG
jgi:hypothetical protein